MPDSGFDEFELSAHQIEDDELPVEHFMCEPGAETGSPGKRGACHLFRHTMAPLMLENGADIRFIQQMLGHARLDTTQIYTQVSIRQLNQIHSATHPAYFPKPRTDTPPDTAAKAALLSALAVEDDEEPL